MILSRKNLEKITVADLILPPDFVFQLPEKVLQFGTGVLLRALPDYFIDKANRSGIFNGRIVVVKSTTTGSTSAFDNQDGLYTLSIKGIENGRKTEETIVSSSISRVLSASSQWKEILACARKKEMQIVISNTTEVGLQLVLENIDQTPPVSFPAKLLAFLTERYKAFNGSEESGMVIIPTELIPDNGKKLKAMVLELAAFNNLDEQFVQWLTNNNQFCSSLVDRIVPGKPDELTVADFRKQVGYDDDLLTASEVYRLWAIEGDEKVKSIVSFYKADEGVIVAPDIELYRELKIRLLNATHTLSCGTAFLAGFDTVREAMEDSTLFGYSSRLMLEEIGEAIPYPIEKKIRKDFALKVLDRFKNPFIKHWWLSITLQYSMKLKMRVLPVLFQYYRNFNKVPPDIALGFAAWILFMKAVKKEGDKYFGDRNGMPYAISDDKAAYFYDQWQRHGEANIVIAVLKDQSLWGEDLTTLRGFAQEVDTKLKQMIAQSVLQTIRDRKK